MAVEASQAAAPADPAERRGAVFDYSIVPARQWRLVGILTVVAMLSALDRQALALLVEPIKADLGLGDGQIGVLMGAAIAVTGLVVGPPAGYLADRLCRRCMIGVSAVLWSLLTGLTGLSASFGQLLMARAGVGLFEGVAAPVTASLLRDALSPERRGRGFAVFAMAPMIGTGLAMLAGGGLVAAIGTMKLQRLPLLGELHPWQMVFVVFGLIGLPAAALVLAIAEPKRVEHEAASSADASIRDALAHMASRWRTYVPLIGFSAMHGMLSLTFAAWAPALLGRTWGLDPARIGLTFGVLMLALAPIGLAAAGVVIDRLARAGRPNPEAVGVAATLVIWFAATAMPIAPSPGLFWTLFALLMLSSGTALPVASTIMAAITPSRVMGKAAALQGVVIGLLSATIAPSIAPILAATVFQGHRRALGEALSLAVFVYGLLALIAILAVRRARLPAAG
jgi:MFS family permease